MIPGKALAFIGSNLPQPEAFLPLCPSSAQNPKPTGLGRARYRGLRQERSIKARDSAMLAT